MIWLEVVSMNYSAHLSFPLRIAHRARCYCGWLWSGLRSASAHTASLCGCHRSSSTSGSATFMRQPLSYPWRTCQVTFYPFIVLCNYELVGPAINSIFEFNFTFRLKLHFILLSQIFILGLTSNCNLFSTLHLWLGNIVSVMYIERIGRCRLLQAGMVSAAVSAFGFGLGADFPAVVIISAALFTAFSTAGWNALDCLSVEVRKTKIKAALFCFCLFCFILYNSILQ